MDETIKQPILSPDEIKRYKRHLLVKEIGGQGQQRLKAARVLIVGAGGLGSPLIMYLAAAGVGTIGIIDDDRVSIDNLQRQIAYKTSDVGALKAECAAALCRSLNPHVSVEAMPFRLTAENALSILSNFDIVADGSDNFSTRYLVNDACYFARKPLVFAALGQLDGYLSTFRAYEKDEAGQPLPSYRCLFPEPPPAGDRCELRRGRGLGAGRGRDRHASSGGSHQSYSRIAGHADGQASDLRRPFGAIPDHRAEVGPGEPLDGTEASDPGSLQSRTVRV